MDIEEIIINLKILEKIEINQKLITRDYLFEYRTSKFSARMFRRWNRQDNRNEAIKKINTIVNYGLIFYKKTPNYLKNMN